MNEAAEPFSLKAAWDDLRSWMKSMVAMLGEPVAIAANLMLRRSDREEILQWLAPLEVGVRRLLLMEALKQPKPNEPPLPIMRGRVNTTFREEPLKTLPEDSREWRVSFRLWPSPRREGPPARPVIRASARAVHYNAFPLARRVEAVIRVLENPDAYIAKPYRPVLRGAEYLLRDIQHETELALETLNSS